MKKYYLKKSGTIKNRICKRTGFRSQTGNEIADSLRPEYLEDYSLLNLVRMSEATVSTSESQRPVIGSIGMGPCVAMAGYDSIQKIGFVSHNSTEHNIEPLHELVLEYLKKISYNNSLEMEIYIVGGMMGSEELVSKLRNIAKEKFNPKTINEDLALNTWTFIGKSFLLDVRDGKVYCMDGGERLQYFHQADPRIYLRK